MTPFRESVGTGGSIAVGAGGSGVIKTTFVGHVISRPSFVYFPLRKKNISNGESEKMKKMKRERQKAFGLPAALSR